jgi:hypothetical protein
MSTINYLFGLTKDKDNKEKMLMQKDLQKFELKEKMDKEEKLNSMRIMRTQEEIEKKSGYIIQKQIQKASQGKELRELDVYISIYQDIKNKFPDIDIEFYIECRNNNSFINLKGVFTQ